jgi:two-component sensor histidine kinase
MRSEEKEIILREMRHRVKNDFAALDGYLSLRIDSCPGAEAASVLREAISRIRGMALLFDRLYGSGGTERPSARDYLPELVHEILAVFGDGRSIGTSFEVEDVAIEPRLLSDLGIIVNELVTNSIKHAFGRVAEPRISLSLVPRDGRLKVVYADNGPGLPASSPPSGARGFGLELIHGLVARHQGAIRIENSGGALFTMDFPAASRS